MVNPEHIKQFESVLNTFNTPTQCVAHHAIRDLLGRVANSPFQDRNNTETWTQIGSIAFVEFSTLSSSSVDTVAELSVFLSKKRHDYGVKNIVEFGEFGIKVRTVDKLARIENMLARSGATAVGEPMVDAWRDIVGYSAVAILLISEHYV